MSTLIHTQPVMTFSAFFVAREWSACRCVRARISSLCSHARLLPWQNAELACDSFWDGAKLKDRCRTKRLFRSASEQLYHVTMKGTGLHATSSIAALAVVVLVGCYLKKRKEKMYVAMMLTNSQACILCSVTFVSWLTRSIYFLLSSCVFRALRQS